MQRAEQSRSRFPWAVGVALLIGAGLWFWRGGDAGEVASEAPGGADARGSEAFRALDGDALLRPKLVIDPRRGEKAAISGTVRDQKGMPIAGAMVCAAARSERLASADTRRASCANSEKDGHYRIEGLFGVKHWVSASAAGFIAEAYHHGEGAARREEVALRPGQEATDIDIVLEGGGVELRGIVKDLSGGAIEGAQVGGGSALGFTGADGNFSLWVRAGESGVWAEAEGYASGWESGVVPGHFFEVYLTPESVLVGKVVRVADGTPVEGARVTAESGGDGWNQASSITDASGSFRLDGLKPGPYKAKAEADDAYGLADEAAILGLGETSEPITVKAHPAFFIEGTLVVADDKGSQAVDQGWVSLSDRANGRSAWGSPEPDGVLRMRGLLPGEFEVEINSRGFVAADRYEKVKLVDKSISGLRWEVTRGQAIRGVVVDASGKPVPRVNVSAAPKPDPSQPRAHQTRTWGGETDANGKFELAGLLAGEYMINVSSWEQPRATPEKPIPATLEKGKDLDGLRVELPATGEVKGSVRDGKGNPIPRANVGLYDGVHWQSAAAGDDGSFSFKFVAAGEYRVTARKGWGDEMRAPGTSDDDVQGEKVSVRAGGVEDVKLVVERSDGRITGVVRDADGGPLADAFIEATRESDSATQSSGQAMRQGRWGSFWDTPELTDPDGRFVLEDLQEGKHTLRAHRKGGGEAILEHVAIGGDVVLTIADAGRMSGTVTLAGGGGSPEEFTVVVRDDTTGFSRNDSFFRTGGVWTLEELPAGKYKVRVTAGKGTAEVEATMAAGQDVAGVRVELAPKVTVRGKVVNLEGEPVPGMRVTVSAEGGGWSFGGDDGDEKLNITDAAGHYEVEHAPTGKVRISVMPRNWGDDQDYDWTSMANFVPASGDVVDLPVIKVAKKRIKQDQAAGDFGYSFKNAEPGADPRERRLIVAVVRPGSVAATGGMKVGDEIVSVDGQDVTGANSYLLGSLTQVVEGTVVHFGLKSGVTLALTAGKRP